MTEVPQTNTPKIERKNSILVNAPTATYNGAIHSLVTFTSNLVVREFVNIRVTQKTKQVEILTLSLKSSIASFPVKFFSYYDQKYIGALISVGLKYNPQDSISVLVQYVVKEFSYVFLQEKTDKIENPYLKMGAQVMTPAAIEVAVPLSFDVYRATASVVGGHLKLINAKTTILDTLNKILADLGSLKQLLPKVDIRKKAKKIKHTNNLLIELFDKNENLHKLIAQIESIRENLLRADFNKQNLFEVAANLRSIIDSVGNPEIVEQIRSLSQRLKKTTRYDNKVMNDEINIRVENFINFFGSLNLKINKSLVPVDKFDEIVDYFVHYKNHLSDYATQWATKTLSPITGYMLQSSLDALNDLSQKSFVEKLEGEEIKAALMKAVKLNDIKFLDLALKMHGKNVTNETYDLAASYAIAKGNVDILALVLESAKEQGVNNVASGANQMSMVDKAIITNNYKMLELLIKYEQNPKGTGLLHYALVLNLFDIVNLLLENGAPIDNYSLVRLMMLLHSPITASLDDINGILKYAEKYIAENKETDIYIKEFGTHADIDTLTKYSMNLGFFFSNGMDSYKARYYAEFFEHNTSPEEYIEKYLPEDIGENFIEALSVGDNSIFYTLQDYHK